MYYVPTAGHSCPPGHYYRDHPNLHAVQSETRAGIHSQQGLQSM